MEHIKSLVTLSSIYLITVLMGLHTAGYVLPLMYPPPGGEVVIAPVVSSGPESVGSSLEILVYILIATASMLVLIRFGLGFIVNAALFLSLLVGTLFTSLAFFGDYALLPVAITLAAVLWLRDNAVVANTALMLTISGVGAVLGASIGLWPAVVLIVLASVYDFAAVFITKHMVKLAEESKGRFAMMFLVPVGDRVMGLGAGDIALPLTFTVSVFAQNGAGYAIPTALGGLLGLISMFYYLLSRKKATLPALPPIALGLLFGYGLTAILLSI
jgi:presenilin-like A22 family membrane protease